MSGAIDPNFWSRLVYQFSSFEPAVRHSVVAISSLFEKLRRDPTGGATAVVLKDSTLALAQYNNAIAELRHSDNEPLIVLACVLFICIEVLQNNTELAVQHCRHGIVLLCGVAAKHGWVREYLVPIFRRMTLLPLFFAKYPDDFPLVLPPLEYPLPVRFETLTHARDLLWDGMIRSMHIMRLGESYREAVGTTPSPASSPTSQPLSQDPAVPQHLLDLQAEATAFLDYWHILWLDVESRPRIEADISKPARQLSRTMLSLRYELCRIWVATAFCPSEMIFDDYIDVFGRCIAQCSVFRTSLPPLWFAAKSQFKFMIETGFSPILYFIAIKCRNLELRLQALQLVTFLGALRENLWDANIMYARGLKIIEAEHGVVLDHTLDQSPTCHGPRILRPAICPGLPPEEWRVRGYWADFKSEEIVQPATRGLNRAVDEMSAEGAHARAERGFGSPNWGVREGGWPSISSDGSSPESARDSPTTSTTEGSAYGSTSSSTGPGMRLVPLAPRTTVESEAMAKVLDDPVLTMQELTSMLDDIRGVHLDLH